MEMAHPWLAVRGVIERRRAIRDFAPSEVDDDDLRAILEAALLAPSSSNLQLFRLHVVKDSKKRAALAHACMSQRAARTAPVLIAVAACPVEAARSIEEQDLALAAEPSLSLEARKHAVRHLSKLRAIVRFTPGSLWVPVTRVALWIARKLAPIPDLATGARAFRDWAVRNSAFAAQTLMLAAEALGYASCPMEGFDRFRVERALGLKNEHVWLVIALGRRAADARVDPRWRRPFSTLVRMH